MNRMPTISELARILDLDEFAVAVGELHGAQFGSPSEAEFLHALCRLDTAAQAEFFERAAGIPDVHVRLVQEARDAWLTALPATSERWS
jgi:hypothetical protein